MAIAIALSSVFTASCPPPGDRSYAVLLPDPTCCNRFFSCSDGVPILMECPIGLCFNEELDVCDWPQSVDCGERALSCAPIITVGGGPYTGGSGGGFGSGTSGDSYDGKFGWNFDHKYCPVDGGMIYNRECYAVGVLTSCSAYCNAPGGRPCTSAEKSACPCHNPG